MPQVSKIKQMPDEDREWLEEWLKDNHFGNLDALVQQLAGRGYEISRSSVGRYSQEFKKHCENIRRSTELAVFLAEQLGDDQNAVGDAAIRTMQAELLQAMTDYDWERIHQMDPGEISLAVSRLSRAGVNQKKWMADVRERVKQVADSVETEAKKGGLSDEAIARIRTDILGIPATP
ncbi:MAG: DUF3486 family protein [Kiritimatiellales bacterium]